MIKKHGSVPCARCSTTLFIISVTTPKKGVVSSLRPMSPYSDVTSSIHTVFNFPRARPLRASSQSNLARRPARSLGKTAWWIGEGKPGDKVESISAMIMDYIL